MDKTYLKFIYILLIYFAYVNCSAIKRVRNHKLNKKHKNGIVIEVDINPAKTEKFSGPYAFIKSINQILPYKTNNCSFKASSKIKPTSRKNKSDYYYYSFPRFNENDYNTWVRNNKANKLILGPNFVPSNWYNFPNPNSWKERRFREILESVKGVVTHSDRVRDHLAEKSNTTSLINKYINVRACTNLKPINVKSFNGRTIDILYFEKYADTDRSKQGKELLELLNNSGKKVVKMEYGSYDKEKMMEWANDSKFILYFSFYDTGAIGLKEIQNYGAITFTHQEEFVPDVTTGYYIPELASEDNIESAYKIIMEIVDKVTKENPDSEIIAKTNQEVNRCERALDDLCQSLS